MENNNQGVMLSLEVGKFFHSIDTRGGEVFTDLKKGAEKFNSAEDFCEKYVIGDLNTLPYIFIPISKIITLDKDYRNDKSDIYDLKLDDLITVVDDCGEQMMGAVMVIDNWRKIVGIWNAGGKYSEHNIDKIVTRVYE